MNSPIQYFRTHARSAISMLAIAGAFVFTSCNDSSFPTNQQTSHITVSQAALDHAPIDWSNQPAFIRHGIEVQERHHKDLTKISGVIGTGISVDENDQNAANVLVFTDREDVAGIPQNVEGVKTHIEYVGKIKPFAGYTGTYRPVYNGVSVGNDNECASGTIGCLVSINGTRYMLSNNHVFARENAALIGERIDQPGRYDKSCGASGQIGALAAYKPIDYVNTNVIDAAVASLDGTVTFNPGEISGYTPTSTVVAPQVNMQVKKTGRTTGLTTGKITGINTTITVQYDGGVATFVNQIYVRGQFIKAGDSGSLMVDSKNNPVGLCFAGGSTSAFANPISAVLGYFGATVVSH